MTISEMEVRQWEIWQVTWRHEDGTAKPRPVVILHVGHPLDTEDSILVCKIQSREHLSERLRLSPEDGEVFKATGLTRACFVYPKQVRVLRIAALVRKRGVLGGPYRVRVTDLIRNVRRPTRPDSSR